MSAAGRVVEVFEVNKQLWQQELLGGMSGKAGKAGTGSHTSGMSCVSPKGAKEEVEHSMLVFPTVARSLHVC